MIKFAFKDLVNRQKKGEKGRNIIYEDLSMSDYLLPETPLTVTEKQNLFAVRTEMNLNPHNYGNTTYCEEGCNELQSNQHIFECSSQNKEESKLKYEDILNGSLQLKIKALKKDSHYISPQSLGRRGLIWTVFHRSVLYTLSRLTPLTKYIYPLLLILRVNDSAGIITRELCEVT